jgi:hypothetical protein
MREKLKLTSDGGDPLTVNIDEGMVAPVLRSGGVCVWRSLESGGMFSIGACGKNLASSAVKMFYI